MFRAYILLYTEWICTGLSGVHLRRQYVRLLLQSYAQGTQRRQKSGGIFKKLFVDRGLDVPSLNSDANFRAKKLTGSYRQWMCPAPMEMPELQTGLSLPGCHPFFGIWCHQQECRPYSVSPGCRQFASSSPTLIVFIGASLLFVSSSCLSEFGACFGSHPAYKASASASSSTS
jgi:hypothetical protein